MKPKPAETWTRSNIKFQLGSRRALTVLGWKSSQVVLHVLQQCLWQGGAFFFSQVVFNNSTGRTGDTGRDAGRTRGRTDTRTHGRTDTALRPHHHGAAARGDERGEATYTTEGTEGILEGECAASAARAFPGCVIGLTMQGRGLSSASQRVRPRLAAPHRPPRAGVCPPGEPQQTPVPCAFGRLHISPPGPRPLPPNSSYR